MVITFLGALFTVMHKHMVHLEARIEEAWNEISFQLKRRTDLASVLISTVGVYAANEKNMLDAVNVARGQALIASNAGPTKAGKADGELRQSMESLFAVAEKSPELTASHNFRELLKTYADIEDKINAACLSHNTAALAFNARRKIFPTSIFATMLGVTTDKEFF